MKEKILILFLLVATAVSLSSVSAAPAEGNFGGNGQGFVEIEGVPGMFNNTRNGLIVHWGSSETSPHHIGLTTTQPGMHANEKGAVEDSDLPGASDVKPSAYWRELSQ